MQLFCEDFSNQGDNLDAIKITNAEERLRYTKYCNWISSRVFIIPLRIPSLSPCQENLLSQSVASISCIERYEYVDFRRNGFLLKALDNKISRV